jgi:hypothetical protein
MRDQPDTSNETEAEVESEKGCATTPVINEGCTRSLRISHTSRRAPLQPVPKAQVPCTPYHPPNIAGVIRQRSPTPFSSQGDKVSSVEGGKISIYQSIYLSSMLWLTTPRHAEAGDDLVEGQQHAALTADGGELCEL